MKNPPSTTPHISQKPHAMASGWNWKVNSGNNHEAVVVDQEDTHLLLLRNCDLPPPPKLFSADRVGLLRALRLSQTRAREAEAKRTRMTKEKDSLSAAFADEAMKVFGCRQLLKLMDFEARLRRSGGGPVAEDGAGGWFPWIVAVAFCLGMLGVGLVVGCSFRYFSGVSFL